MATRLFGEKLDGKRLGFMALAFAALFCASSIKIHRAERAESKTRNEIKVTLETLQLTSREVARFQIAHIATHGYYSAKEIDDRATRVTKDYYCVQAFLAHEFAHVFKDNEQATITLARADSFTIKAKLDNPLDDYFYDRLILEKRRQEGELSQNSYQEELNQMLLTYASRLPETEVPSNEEGVRRQLRIAEQQIAQMQTQVNSLKDQLVRAERLTSERWIPIVVAILSALIALSANVIAWRADRRQIREAELVPLKRQELEKNIIQKDQQIRESTRRIITPSPQEVQLYSRVLPVDNFKRGVRSKAGGGSG